LARRADEFAHIVDLFSIFGTVSVRRMFGGAGLYAEGTMFALLVDGVIYLKASDATIPAFEREGCAPFSYATKSGTRALISYWRMPERLYDDPDELATWAREALTVARRGRPKDAGRKSDATRARRGRRPS
jgi:DNA transformation protein